ncbi:MAG: HAD family phosphatase [Flavobacteriales bacterium]|nr:HAD family phosphatase [Flavobacteriales bacterium]
MNTIRNIIFDLGGVLLPVDYQVVIRAFEELGVSDAAQMYSQQAQQPLFDQLERGEISGGEFLFELKKKMPSVSETDILKAWNAILGQFPSNRLELLLKVKQQYRIYLLSNTNEIHIRQFLADLKYNNGVEDFTSFFEEVYYSNETGFRKPEKEIFDLVLLDNNLNASETLFIEDTEHNVRGAVQAGIPTLWLNIHEGDTIENYFDENGMLNITNQGAVIFPNQ